MPTGGCFCGAISYETPLKVNGTALCHCADCKKMSGSVYSTNVLTPKDSIKITKGTPKEYTKTADSGKKITNTFCGDCGTVLYRNSETFGENSVIKAGTLDGSESLNDLKPALELYVGERPKWIGQVQDTKELPGMF